MGTVVDKYGLRISWLATCSILISLAHITLGFSDLTPIPSFLVLGFSYAIYGVVIWPSVATVAQFEEEEVFAKTGTRVNLMGVAFGMSTSALNTGLTIIPLIAASIRVSFDSFIYLEGFFSCLGMTSLAACLLLYLCDQTDYVLQLPYIPKSNHDNANQPIFGNSGYDISSSSSGAEAESSMEGSEMRVEISNERAPFLQLFSIDSRLSPKKRTGSLSFLGSGTVQQPVSIRFKQDAAETPQTITMPSNSIE